jgi:hypothetical protein
MQGDVGFKSSNADASAFREYLHHPRFNFLSSHGTYDGRDPKTAASSSVVFVDGYLKKPEFT